MITYNMRYRGPYEYDKFALNILQYKNTVTDIINEIDKNKKDNLYSKSKKLEEYIDDVYDIQHKIFMMSIRR